MINRKKISLWLLLLPVLILKIGSQEAGPDLLASSAVLYDYTTGRILYEKNADYIIAPASMTKLVTLYLGWQSLEEGENSQDDPVAITSGGSSFSRPAGSSLMLLEEGQNVTYLEILKGLAISSGNDAAYALAIHLGGTVETFVEEMNFLVQSMGYKSMYFEDPDGWSAHNTTSAREYAAFAADYIRSFPHALKTVHSQEYFIYPKPENLPSEGGRIITARKKKNTNILLGKVPGVDGLKTGYIDESGFNFTATAMRNTSRFIAVVMGIKDVSYFEGIEIRAAEAAELLEYGFDNFRTIYPEIPLLEDLQLWEGTEDFLSVHIDETPVFTLSIDEMTGFSQKISLPDEITAPVMIGDQIGSLVFKTDSGDLKQYAIRASESIEKGNIFKVLWHRIVRWFNRF